MIKQAARGRQYQYKESSRSRSGFVRFLESIGLTWIAGKIIALAQGAFKWLWALVFG